MEINGKNYQFAKLSARKQFHIMRRLTPVISDFAPVLKLLNTSKDADQTDLGLEVIEHIGKALGALNDADADFVLDGLLDSVSRDNGQGLGFTPIRVNGVGMYSADIDMPTELILAFHAIKANFADFIPAIRSIIAKSQLAPSVQ